MACSSIANTERRRIVVVSRACTHAPVVCANCLAQHIDTSLNGKVFSEVLKRNFRQIYKPFQCVLCLFNKPPFLFRSQIVKCPSCVIVMTYEDIRKGAKKAVFERQLRPLLFHPSTPPSCAAAPSQATTDFSACKASKRTPTSATARLQAAAAASFTSAAAAGRTS